MDPRNVPVNVSLRNPNPNEVQLTIRCDDKRTLHNFAEWVSSEVRGLSAIASKDTPITISEDTFFEQVKQAA